MNSIPVILVFGLIFCSFNNFVLSDEPAVEEGVLVLKTSNFKQAIADNEFILVEFYAPWCGHCKALAPEYAKAAKKLEEEQSKIKLAKVDATEEDELAGQFGIRGYPTLKFFKSGTPIDYNGGRMADDIANWLKKKTGPPAKELSKIDDVKKFIEENKVGVVGFFSDKESDSAKVFLSVAFSNDDLPFAIVSNNEIANEFETKDESIVLYKKFDDQRVVFKGDMDEQSIKTFIVVESLPFVVDFNQESAQKIFGGDIKSHLLVFMSKESGDYDKYLENVKNVAKHFRSKVLFVAINTDEEEHNRIVDFFGMKKEDIPSMRLIRLEDEMEKYKPEVGELTVDNIQKFVQAYVDGKLKRHLLSEELPKDWDEKSVKVLVQTNFDEIAFDKSKSVLVEFYAPWCGHCKQLAPIYDELGDKYNDRDDVVIAKIDATANELEHTKINSFPTLKLYKKGTNEVVEYNGERTLDGLAKFVDSNGEYGQVDEHEIEEETEDADLHPKDEL